MLRLFTDGEVMKHIAVTMEEIFVGTAIGIAIGLVLGYVMAKLRWIERLVMPFVIIVQTAPKISLAPLFILWMGLGIESKAGLVILVVAFPSMMTEVAADRS
ncbi:MAG: ABC transporter permease, partial [Lachnospiraceae bacterium]|nr:ABC transporter permease [Lachnospiraceae bacterium]